MKRLRTVFDSDLVGVGVRVWRSQQMLLVELGPFGFEFYWGEQ